ncbi:hypothetical protein [Owenweeksia hongkongensis]|uniref:hypothetical protein n=1 Tax=Owenweeksia hongkongensis TaxID=253245 RepID=UPI003A9541C7
MKTNLLLVLALIFVLSSCYTPSSLPSGVYLQNSNLMEKPLYRGENESMLQISAGYSKLGIGDSELENDNNFFYSGYYDYKSTIDYGFAEIVYGRSQKRFSYALGLTGMYGSFRAESSSPFVSSRGWKYATYGLGAKANISYDINSEKVSLRVAQLQVGVSRDFGEYGELRDEWYNAGERSEMFSVTHPRDALVCNASLSIIANFKMGKYSRIRLGGGIGYMYVTEIYENSITHQFDCGLGYKAFDLIGTFVIQGSDPAIIDEAYKIGLGYRIPLKKNQTLN